MGFSTVWPIMASDGENQSGYQYANHHLLMAELYWLSIANITDNFGRKTLKIFCKVARLKYFRYVILQKSNNYEPFPTSIHINKATIMFFNYILRLSCNRSSLVIRIFSHKIFKQIIISINKALKFRVFMAKNENNLFLILKYLNVVLYDLIPKIK